MVTAFVKTFQRTFGLNPAIQSPTSYDWSLVAQIEARSLELENLTDNAITSAATSLREAQLAATISSPIAAMAKMSGRLSSGRRNHDEARPLDEATVVQGCSLVREAVRRVTGKAYFRVQMLAGLILSRGCVAEMHTGEGKTLTSAIPAFMQSFRYPGVHVATPNAYLANRDFEELHGVYELLGLKVGLLPEQHEPKASRDAYQCHVTYGAGYAFGFDFLRDELTRRRSPSLSLGQATMLSMRGLTLQSASTLQAGHWCSLVDEIDSVLLDEAMTPLILSAGSQQTLSTEQLFRLADKIADTLQQGTDFQVLAIAGKTQLTSEGLKKAEHALSHPLSLGIAAGVDLRAGLKRPWSIYVENAIQAKYILKPDVDYVVRSGAVQIVDQKTGRIFSDRSWRSGLHQAVESRVGVRLSEEKASVGRITRQMYYKLYASLCGMTGTAAGAETEFEGIYGLKTVRIPLNRLTQRITTPDRYFVDRDAKFHAAVAQAAERHSRHQPVLIGTRTIADSEEISSRLKAGKISHVVLNGKQDQEEADIVSAAGRAGTVTVATNMAGRGTDIKPDQRAIAAGGLHVICVERHESRRVDGQLAGRAARAGAPGSCQFFVSAEDELIRTHAPTLAGRMRTSADSSGESHQNFGNAIERLQSVRERISYELRLAMMRQDGEMHDLLRTLCFRTDG